MKSLKDQQKKIRKRKKIYSRKNRVQADALGDNGEGQSGKLSDSK